MDGKLPILFDNKKCYDIIYDSSFDKLSDFIKEYSGGNRKLCVVSDSKVASIYSDAILHVLEDVSDRVVLFTFPEGEASKNLDVVRDIYVKLIEEHFNRGDMLIALGGGVTGDMCGYAAATYLRGIDFIQVPTSLLADVDSSIGGKTGVDFEQYKNMVGAFHMPKLVLINVDTLKTLDKRQLWSGMGEVVKSALIRDAELYNWLEENIDNIGKLDDTALLSMIYRCNIIKKNVVELDPHEITGERALLNFGHTLGHAIEKYMDFQLLHGECVSIGCMMAAYISEKKGSLDKASLDRICRLIYGSFNLPKLGDIDVKRIVEFTHSDKKATAGGIKFILLKGIGDAYIDMSVSDSDMEDAINWYLNQIQM